MTDTQYSELIEFLGRRFDSIDRRLEALEQRVEALEKRMAALEDRVTKVEVGQESMLHQLQILAEGVAMANDRLDRLEAA
ncbi:MAG: hypothetical protein ACYTG4_11465 [Planctomycetota bacterium]